MIRPFLRPIAGLALVATLGAGCGVTPPATTTGAATTNPTGCRTAPDPGNLPDWQPPSKTPAMYPLIIANPGELTCGHNRLLFTFLDASTNVVSKPDLAVTVSIYALGQSAATATTTAAATFVWAIENVRGIYVMPVDFTEAGIYGAEFSASQSGGAATKLRATFSVDSTSPVVQVGQKAPSTKTPTAADVGGDLHQISTDPTPDPSFYKVSEDAALAAHQPMVVIFATPKFCTSAQCGPTLDRIKPFAARYAGVAFIHVEPYQLKLQDGQLQAVLDAQNQLVSNSVTTTWGLTGEPWVFVVDKTGTITASFELIFSDAELTTALEAVK